MLSCQHKLQKQTLNFAKLQVFDNKDIRSHASSQNGFVSTKNPPHHRKVNLL